MLSRTRFLLAISLLVTLGLVACGEESPAIETPAAVAATAAPIPTAVAAVAPTAVPAIQPAQQAAASPTPTPTIVAPAGEEPTPVPTPTEVPVAVVSPAPTPTATATPEPTPTPVPEPQPTAVTNGVAPRADVAFQTEADKTLTTVEVVKSLRFSVVHVATSLDVGMGMFNQPIPEGVGTGVILDRQGHILTNNHVVRDAQQIIVTLDNDQSFPAVLIGGNVRTDTAVVRIDAEDLIPAKLGVSAELEVGEDVIAIGHALGLRGGPTVSKGVVSALGRSIPTGPQTTIVDLIQTDASINPGNSGGPLVNDRAEVVGINTAIISESQGIGFAINIDDAKVVVVQLITKGYVERGFIGITPVDLTPAAISQVGRGFPAAVAGIRGGDVIVEMAGQTVVNTGQLSKFLMSHLPGERVEITYYRGTEKIGTEVTLAEQPPEVR